MIVFVYTLAEIPDISESAAKPSLCQNVMGVAQEGVMDSFAANLCISGSIRCDIVNPRPTSVEPERAFPAARLLCTRIRSRLNDATLDTLCFLRSYYRKR